jgi:ABC-type Fe3+-hydroxamate transport system substrate-binding protein
VVSLVPSATETLLAWGVIPVACTRFCEQPSLAHVGGTKDPDIAAVVALRPDVVVLCDQENRLPDAEALTAAGLAIHVVSITDVEQVPGQMRLLAAAVGLRPQGLPGTGDLEQIAQRADGLRAYIPIWKRPWMSIGAATYGSTLLASLGVENVLGDHADPYPAVDIAEVAALRVEVVLAPSEPYPFAERHRALLEQVAPVRFVDGQDLFWWGARTDAARRRLARAVLGG